MPYSSARPAGVSPWFVVVHTGEGILDRNDMARFLDNNPEASAHAAADAAGVAAPLVPYAAAAWTAGPTANGNGLHIELCAFAAMTRDQWLSEDDVDVWIQWINGGRGAWRHIRSPKSMLRNAAAWVRDRCAQYGIAVRKIGAADLRADRDGICGHADTSAAWGETDHTDPGPNFPWPEFIALIKGNEEDDVSWADNLKSPRSGQEAPAKDWLTLTNDKVTVLVEGEVPVAGEDRKTSLLTEISWLPANFKLVLQQIAGLTAAFNMLADKVGQQGGASAAELKAAVAEAIKENVVHVDVSVSGTEHDPT